MSIPLVQEATKDAINTSIIAIKRNIERINMLLGLVDSGSPDLSGLATKQELQDAVNSLQPVDEVAIGNMQSVTSNAVARDCPLKTLFANTIFLGENTQNATITLEQSLADYNFIYLAMYVVTASYGGRMTTRVIPVDTLRFCNATTKAYVLDLSTGGGAMVSVMLYYIDDTHIATFNRENQNYGTITNIYCTIKGFF